MDSRDWENRRDDLLEGCSGAAIPADAPDLTEAVLARTSGSACGRAGDLLAAFADGAPDLGDAQLLHAHLDRCPACRALAATLAWLTPELRGMAGVAPDSAFLADVLTATARLRASAAARARRQARFAGRVEAVAGVAGVWWRRQLERPRFALEFAYVATMILLALCATPVSPLRSAPQKALAVVEASPAGVATVSAWIWRALPASVAEVGRAAWDVTGGRVTGAISVSADRLAARGRRTAPLRADLARHLGDTGRALVQFDFVQAAGGWNRTRADLTALWRAWRTGGRIPAAGDARARA
jgi:hypothetical protein